jgi:rhodanese-related sulfurtransferase
MDTTKPSSHSSSSSSSFSCPPAGLAAQWDANDRPLLIDVRKNEAFIASEHTLPGALRRDPLQLETWAGTLPAATAVLVYCVHGHEVSQNTMAALRQRGRNACFLEGGIEAWREQGLPLMAKAAGSSTRWVTRERPKIDRIACPWLLRRFVDAQAQFLYVPTDQVAAVARREAAMAYDVNAEVTDTRFTHEGELCSFDAFVKIYRLGADTALVRLAEIVRGADTNRLDLAPQAAGLLAVSLGMSRTMTDDHAMLEAMMPVYDALYAWCRDAVAGSDEQHSWKPA